MARSQHKNPPIEGVSAFILAGGESSRMGRHKALLELGGVPMIVRAARLVESVSGAVAGRATIVGEPESYQRFGLRAIRDDWPGAGPLGGIATALRASDRAWNLIVACDLPYLTRDWLEFLIERGRGTDADALLPMNERGAEPLCAMYAKSAEAAIWLALDRGVRKVTDGLGHLHVEYVEQREWKAFDSECLLFKNMNSPEDYEQAKARVNRPEKDRRKPQMNADKRR
ncbi:MAG TPA: molybdenum cofactor guanylyltransferase [Candidatus Acidoferrales bacterium]|nr:molybdenum cofactor guanylyltransferase [Candidatus Acidoferrales bacterium]